MPQNKYIFIIFSYLLNAFNDALVFFSFWVPTILQELVWSSGDKRVNKIMKEKKKREKIFALTVYILVLKIDKKPVNKTKYLCFVRWWEVLWRKKKQRNWEFRKGLQFWIEESRNALLRWRHMIKRAAREESAKCKRMGQVLWVCVKYLREGIDRPMCLWASGGW